MRLLHSEGVAVDCSGERARWRTLQRSTHFQEREGMKRRSSLRPTGAPFTPSLSMVILMLLLLVSSPTAKAWWKPGPGVSWQWQMTGDLVLSLEVDMYNLDLFDVTEVEIEELRDREVVVICSFSAGVLEEDRPDAGDFPPSTLGPYINDGGNRWLNITDKGVLTVMERRFDLAVNKSCSGVAPSDVEVFDLENKMNITATDQLEYNKWLANEAHARNLSVGLRKDWTQLTELQPFFDWALSENCLSEGECGAYRHNFVDAGKAVLDAEFFQFSLAFCDNLTASGMDVIVKDASLDERRCSCQDPSTHINCEELLDQTEPGTKTESSYWVIATAGGGALVILLIVTGIVFFAKRKPSVGDPVDFGSNSSLGELRH